MEDAKRIDAYVADHWPRFLQELCSLVAIPTISTDPASSGEVARGAARVRELLLAAGADHARVVPTAGHPVVLGRKSFSTDPATPTVLVYGHYDVQPVEPLDAWQTPPFVPEVRDGAIHGRGTADDKGQFFIHLKAMETLAALGLPACNLLFLIEGEEEIGSPSLPAFLADHRDELAAEAVVISDTDMLENNRPAITVGLRGLAALEVTVQGADRDLHSGIYGGAVANPALELARLLARLHDHDHRVTVPGFYARVREVPVAERAALAPHLPDPAWYRGNLGVEPGPAEAGYSPAEAATIRPALDVNGLAAGYTGPGFKTVLPASATARLSVRLVPEQDPDEITGLLADWFQAQAPAHLKVTVTRHHGGAPILVPPDFPALAAARAALAEVFGQEPALIRSGGTIPVVPLLAETLGLHAVLLGFGQPSDNIHGPNEHFGVENFLAGVRTVARFYRRLAVAG